MIAIRDDAFAALGDAAPVFTVDTVTENPNQFVRRRIEGTFELPLYLRRMASPADDSSSTRPAYAAPTGDVYA